MEQPSFDFESELGEAHGVHTGEQDAPQAHQGQGHSPDTEGAEHHPQGGQAGISLSEGDAPTVEDAAQASQGQLSGLGDSSGQEQDGAGQEVGHQGQGVDAGLEDAAQGRSAQRQVIKKGQYSQAEDDALLAMLDEGASFRSIAEALSRTTSSIQSRLRKLRPAPTSRKPNPEATPTDARIAAAADVVASEFSLSPELSRYIVVNSPRDSILARAQAASQHSTSCAVSGLPLRHDTTDAFNSLAFTNDTPPVTVARRVKESMGDLTLRQFVLICRAVVDANPNIV